MILITFLLALNPIFATGISFSKQQCERFKAEGITGGDYYINEALARDCGIQVPDGGGYFPSMVMTENSGHKKNCGLKNLALDGSHSGYLQDVVVFNNLEKIEPDTNDDYPWVMKLFAPTNDGTGNFRPSSAISVDISSMPECELHLKREFGNKVKTKNLIFTTAHSLYDEDKCNIMSENKASDIHIFTGKDMQHPSGKIPVEGFVCAEYECDKVKTNVHNDLCVLFPEEEPAFSAEYKEFDQNSDEEYKLIAFQGKLSRFTNRFTEHQRVISRSDKKPEFKNVHSLNNKPYKALYVYMDADAGASGGAISDSPNSVTAIFSESSEEALVGKDRYQKGYENGLFNNFALDIKKACLKLRKR